MTKKKNVWTVPAEVSTMPAAEAVTGAVLRRALGSLEEPLGEVTLAVRELVEAVDTVGKKGSSDYREIRQVQDQIRSTQDQDRATSLAALGDLKTQLVSMQRDDERSRKGNTEMLTAVVQKLDAVQDWMMRHDGYHDGEREGKRTTGETIAIARETARANAPAGVTNDTDTVWQKLPPWARLLATLLAAAGGGSGLTAALQSLLGGG